MNLRKIFRLPRRLRDDLKIVGLAKNWREILSAKASNKAFLSIRFRNGLVLDSPPEVMLNFLFHEIWIDTFYAPDGYEIKEGETIVDIGGNIGVFALWAATRAKNVRVLAFEPFPTNAEYFRANVNASEINNVEFSELAVADRPGKRTLRVEDSWILHSLVQNDSDVKGIEVTCTSLDVVLADIERCDFLKLDCEGGEYDILYAASPNTLRKIKRIVCEFNVLDNQNKNGNGLGGFLSSNGFVVEKQESLGEACGVICAKNNIQ